MENFVPCKLSNDIKGDPMEKYTFNVSKSAYKISSKKEPPQKATLDGDVGSRRETFPSDESKEKSHFRPEQDFMKINLLLIFLLRFTLARFGNKKS